MMSTIRKNLIAGLLVWVPVLVTLWIVKFFVQLLDQSLSLLPLAYHPDKLLGFHLPGLGVILCFVILFLTGLIATNILGHQLVKFWDYVIAKIPLIRSIYAAIKQIMETLFNSGSQTFGKVLLVQYPRKGLWSIAFQTSKACDVINVDIGEPSIAVFIPTTPNPTSGFLIFVAEKDILELNMSVDVALKMVVSLGVMQPGVNMERGSMGGINRVNNNDGNNLEKV